MKISWSCNLREGQAQLVTTKRWREVLRTPDISECNGDRGIARRMQGFLIFLVLLLPQLRFPLSLHYPPRTSLFFFVSLFLPFSHISSSRFFIFFSRQAHKKELAVVSLGWWGWRQQQRDCNSGWGSGSLFLSISLFSFGFFVTPLCTSSLGFFCDSFYILLIKF